MLALMTALGFTLSDDPDAHDQVIAAHDLGVR
jgi:hypothetical protein